MKSFARRGLLAKRSPLTRNHRVANSRRKQPLFARLSIEPLENRWALTTFTVNTLADTVDADPAVMSLRDAITAANSQAGDSIINFSVTGTISPS